MKFFHLLAAWSSLLPGIGVAAQWTATCDTLGPWTVGRHASALGNVEVATWEGRPAIQISSESEHAPGKWISLSSRETFAVTPGDELVLHTEIAARAAGKAFATVLFEPVRAESRIDFPRGTFGWKTVSHGFQVPPGAERARVIFGVEAETEALWIAAASVSPSLTRRTELAANWQPRPHARVFPQAGPPAQELVALDIGSLSADERLLAITLQGLINRKQPRIYLFQGNQDRFWAERLTADGPIKKIREVPGLAELVEEFRAEFDGVIVDDPALPASRHAAVMLGSLKGWPATSASTAAALHLPVRENLAGRWKKNVEAYREIWATHRQEFASHVLAVHHPFMIQQGPRDYLFQQKIFTFWVSGQSDNEPGADPAAELDFAHEILAATPPNIPVMGWWAFGDDKGIPEYDAVRLCSSYAKFLAGSEYCTNLSLLSGIPVRAETFRQRPTPDHPIPPGELSVSLSVMDSGDSQWYWQHYQPKIWQDPTRGRTPINWSLNPTVADVLPFQLAWYYRTATANDFFYCAISGLGYMSPRVYATRFAEPDRARIWTDYTQELARYMAELDLTILGLYTGSWGESRAGMDTVYAQFFEGAPNLRAILSDFGRHDETTPDNAIAVIAGRPVFHTQMRWLTWTKQDQLTGQLGQEERSVEYTLNELLAHAPARRPGLMSGLLLSWTMSPSLVERVTAKLPADIGPVNADVLVERWKKARGK